MSSNTQYTGATWWIPEGKVNPVIVKHRERARAMKLGWVELVPVPTQEQADLYKMITKFIGDSKLVDVTMYRGVKQKLGDGFVREYEPDGSYTVKIDINGGAEHYE